MMAITYPATIPARRRPIVATAKIGLAAGAIALAAMTAATANAQPAQTEQQIKAGCGQAGGTYSTYVISDGTRYSACCYRDYKGQKYCDAYVNGGYTATKPQQQPPPPGAPGTGGNPPVANPPVTNPPAAPLFP